MWNKSVVSDETLSITLDAGGPFLVSDERQLVRGDGHGLLCGGVGRGRYRQFGHELPWSRAWSGMLGLRRWSRAPVGPSAKVAFLKDGAPEGIDLSVISALSLWGLASRRRTSHS